MAKTICRIATALFALLYGVALFLFLTGTFGWFGQPRDPLSGLFLIPLGVPWDMIDVTGSAGPVFTALAPLINLIIIILICRIFRSKREASK